MSSKHEDYEQEGEISSKDIQLTETACYEDTKKFAALNDSGVSEVKPKTFTSYKCTFTLSKHNIVFGLGLEVLAIGLVIICIGFGVEIIRLRSEISSLTTSQRGTSDEVSSLQQVFKMASENPDNITITVSILAQLNSLQEALNTVSERLDNISITETTLASLQQALSTVSERLDNITITAATLDQVASLQQAFDTVSERLDDINMTVPILQQAVSERESNFTVQAALIDHVTYLQQIIYQLYYAIMQLSQAYSNRIQQLDLSIENLATLLSLDLVPAPSCAALPPSFPSGYYWVRASGGSVVHVYCDMTRSCGGVTGGWMRVAQLDMTNTSHQCPSPLRESTQSNICTCVRNEPEGGCSSIRFSTNNVNYSSVCGKVIAYQHGELEAFNGGNIDFRYVDGVSLTHGVPRQHIWTFAAAIDELATRSQYSCPCIRADRVNRLTANIPSFVGDNYFCDTGSQNESQINVFYGDNPLWDGAG